jgi:endogenous inhibitor of DNA gyrase (YacG/DUF329 family)
MSEIKVKCPKCKTEYLYDVTSAHRPFCSERCRLIDLGAWAEMAYKMPTNEAPSEEELMAALEKQEGEGF